MPASDNSDQRRGIITAIGCYTLWGSLPLYWKLLSGLSSFEVLAYRMFWCLVFVLIYCCVIRRTSFMYLFRDRRAVMVLLCSGACITINWGLYIWAVNSGHVIEAALGSYINSFITIFLGMIFFHERMSKVQCAAFGLTVIGVGYITLDYGQFPWISLVLALMPALYGAIKKWGAYPSVPGMAVESTFTGLLGLVFVLVGLAMPDIWNLTPATTSSPLAVHEPWLVNVLLIGGGLATFAPLQLYSEAVNKVSLVLIGFIRYISPTIALVLAVLIFGEAFTFTHAVCFTCIWVGIAAIAIEAAWKAHRQPTDEQQSASELERLQ